MIISEVMEQLLSQLGESLSVGEMGELGEGGGEELPREVVQVARKVFLDNKAAIFDVAGDAGA